MNIDQKRFALARSYLKRGWRTVPEVMRHAKISRRTAYRWLASLWHEAVKRGSRDRTEYRIVD